VLVVGCSQRNDLGRLHAGIVRVVRGVALATPVVFVCVDRVDEIRTRELRVVAGVSVILRLERRRDRRDGCHRRRRLFGLERHCLGAVLLSLERVQKVGLRTELRHAVLDLRECRQVFELLQTKIVQEFFRCPEHGRFARHVAVTDDANPIALEQGPHDVGAHDDAPHLLDLGARNRLTIRDQRQRLEQRTSVARCAFLPQRLQPIGHRALDLNAVTRGDFSELDATGFVILRERVEDALQRGAIGAVAFCSKDLDQTIEGQRPARRQQRGFDYVLDLGFIHCIGRPWRSKRGLH
jgi:hypothetical protein